MSSEPAGHYAAARIRAALVHFITGKLLSGALGIATLLLTVRGLPVAEYGVYASLVATQLMLLAVSSLGIEPATERFVPEIRVSHAPAALARLLLAGLCARLLTLAVLMLVLMVAGRHLLGWLRLDAWQPAFEAYYKVIFAAGLFQMLSAALEALLEQRRAQQAMMANAALRCALVGYLVAERRLDIAGVILAEGCGLALGCALAALPLVGHVREAWRARTEPGPHAAPRELWRRMRRYARYNYLAQCLMQGYGQDMMRLLLTRFVGVAETARYGFAVALSDMVNRYLPAVLFLRLIRPIFVSRYAVNRDFAQLNAFAALIMKLNLFVLAPLLALLAVHGDGIARLVGGAQYADAGWLVFGVLLLLVPTSHQWTLSLLANTLECNELQMRGALLGLLGLPAAYLGIRLLGEHGVLVGPYASATAYNAYATHYLRRLGYDYRQDYAGLARLLAAAGLAAGAALLAGSLPYAVPLAGAVYLGACYRLKPFSADEQALLARGLLGIPWKRRV
ncbi:MAG: hypothetical protein AMXMBFR6_02100 [Betaproteobacteria bacterium]